MALVYGKNVAYSGPLYDSAEAEGDKIRIHFKHADGLNAKSGPPTHFQIAGSEGKFVPAEATIEGQSIVVQSPDVDKPVAVRFAWDDTAEPNLFNGAGLPASPFRTDRFPLLTSGKK
jgi:sialate O-acetylesterase